MPKDNVTLRIAARQAAVVGQFEYTELDCDKGG
jgi:hypothetical protein